MSKKAMKLALELFEQFGRDSRLKYEHQAIYKTIVALKEALAKQEQGETVAYLNPDDLCANTAFRWCKINEFTQPVYTTPQQRKPLTDDEFTTAVEVAGIPVEDVEHAFAIKDLVEAAHGIKE